MNTLNINQTAAELNQHGINTIPTRPDTTKRPAIAWKQWATDQVPATNIDTWFPEGTSHGIGITTGLGSGGLEMTEIEGRAAHQIPTLIQRAQNAGHGELVNRVMAGWTEQSPSGGYHWIYRLESIDVPGNTVLARNHNREVLIETRGQGGYFIAAPTPGTHHHTGKPWVRLTGGPDTIATLTKDERAAFHALLATFDETPPAPEPTPPPARTYDTNGDWTEGKRPGEHFELETSWDEILTPHGWTYLRTDPDGTRYWLRPGKDPATHPDDKSATTSHADDRDRMYVFSTSTDLPTDEPLTKFYVHAHLNHGGDLNAAAQALAHDGWGKERTIDINIADIMPATRTETTTWNSSTTSSSTTPHTTAGSSPSKPSNTPQTPNASTTDTSATSTTESPNTPTTSSTTTDSTPATTTTDSTTSPAKTSNSATEPAASTSPSTTPTSTSSTPPATPAPKNNDTYGTLAETDDGNAQTLITTYGHILRYVPARKKWIRWNGTIWETHESADGPARELAKHLARQQPETDTTQKTWKKRSLSANGVSNTLTQACTDPRITTRQNDLDNHPYELNTPDGIINLKTGELTPPDPAKLHTKSTTVTPDPEADRTAWNDFLADTFPDQTIRDYMQRLIGYAAIGEVTEHILPFAYGTGKNGKSVFFETIMTVLGDYASSAPAGFLMEQTYKDHTTNTAELTGQRMVVQQEFNEKDKFDEAKVKSLTGGDTITARFLYEGNFTFTPTHTLFIAGNHEPSVDSGGDGFWRRLRKIPFLHKVPAHKRNKYLQRQLETEHASAILAWIVEGAVWYLKDGLMEPESIQAATEEYKEAQDTIARFLEERCVLYPNNRNYVCSVKRFRQEYEEWCWTEGEKPVKGRSLSSQLKQQGVMVGKDAPTTSQGRVYGGIRLASDEKALQAEHGRLDVNA